MSIKVLFLSRHNAARSQLAEYLLNHMGRGRFEAFSAGNVPTSVHPLAIRVLEESRINARDAVSKPLELFEDEDFDYVINICDESSASCDGRKSGCPFLPGIKSDGCWGFGSMPSGDDAEVLNYLRWVREQLTNRLRIWMPAVDKHGVEPSVGIAISQR
jgi:arsenate reductase (thioredoxin)